MKLKLPGKSKPSKGCSKDQSRPHLTRATIRKLAKGKAEMITTDAYKMVVLTLEVEGKVVAMQVPAEALKAVERARQFEVQNGHVIPLGKVGESLGVLYEHPKEKPPEFVKTLDKADADFAAIAPENRFTFGINAKFLLDVAQALGAPYGGAVQVTIDLSKAVGGSYNHPLRVVAQHGAEDGRAYLMPIRVER
jgi:hypothetical protein